MEAENRPGSCYLTPRDRFVEKPLPDIHIGCKKIGIQSSEEIEGKISDNKEDNDHCHRADDGTNGILGQG